MRTSTVHSIDCHLNKAILFIIILFFSSQFAFAQGYSSGSGAYGSSTSGLYTGLGYQVHSLPMSGSQMFGPEMSYEVWGRSRLGARYLFSSEKKDEQRVNVFWKIPLSQRYYHWVFEPHYSYLLRPESRGGEFSTTGFGFGYEGVFSNSISWGAMAGVERSGPVFPVGPFWDRPFLILYTNIGF